MHITSDSLRCLIPESGGRTSRGLCIVLQPHLPAIDVLTSAAEAPVPVVPTEQESASDDYNSISDNDSDLPDAFGDDDADYDAPNTFHTVSCLYNQATIFQSN